MPFIFNKILVICVGNICRSPMGEGLLAQALKEAGQEDVEVRSAGLDAMVGYPADKVAQRLMRERGIDISSHRAHQLNRELMRWAELILVMEKAHKISVESWDPSARGKVYRFGEWSGFDIPDPYRQSDKEVENAFGLIIKGVSDWIPKLTGGIEK